MPISGNGQDFPTPGWLVALPPWSLGVALTDKMVDVASMYNFGGKQAWRAILGSYLSAKHFADENSCTNGEKKIRRLKTFELEAN